VSPIDVEFAWIPLPENVPSSDYDMFTLPRTTLPLARGHATARRTPPLGSGNLGLDAKAGRRQVTPLSARPQLRRAFSSATST
jgi:hypothetical protein